MRSQNLTLRHENQRLQRELLERDGQIAGLKRQVDNLKRFDETNPADLFAPVKLEIASLSGGADYDDQPGDDGVTVHLRLHDSDGYVVKAPGRITVQLNDLTQRPSRRLLGVCVVEDADKLRKSWFGRFGTNHYTVECPFAPEASPPPSRRVVVHVEFVDYLTGRVLTAVREVRIAIPGQEDAAPPPDSSR